jgi:hypothetical protein
MAKFTPRREFYACLGFEFFNSIGQKADVTFGTGSMQCYVDTQEREAFAVSSSID